MLFGPPFTRLRCQVCAVSPKRPTAVHSVGCVHQPLAPSPNVGDHHTASSAPQQKARHPWMFRSATDLWIGRACRATRAFSGSCASACRITSSLGAGLRSHLRVPVDSRRSVRPAPTPACPFPETVMPWSVSFSLVLPPVATGGARWTKRTTSPASCEPAPCTSCSSPWSPPSSCRLA